MDKTSSAPATDDGEAGRVKSLDDRFGAIEARQEKQEGLLEQILGKLGGGGGEAEPVTRGDEPAAPSPGEMAEQMRQAVRDVRAEEAAEQARAAHDADHAKMRTPEPEQTPREVMIRGKARLQRLMFGAER